MICYLKIHTIYFNQKEAKKLTQNTNGAVGTGGTQALDVLNSRQIRFVIQGMFYAMMSGLLVAVQGNVSSIVQTYAPFIDLPTGVALGILAVICLSFCQELIAFIVLLIVNTIRGTGPREYIRLYASGKPALFLFLAGCGGGPFGICCQLIAMSMCGVTITTAIAVINPIIAAVLSRIFLKENIKPRVWVGIVIVIAGAIMAVVGPSGGDQYPHFFIGVLFALLGSFGWGMEGFLGTFGSDIVDTYVGCGCFRIGCSTPILFILTILVGGFCGIGFGDGPVIVGEILTDGANVVPLILLGICEAMAAYTTYLAFDKAGAARTLVFVNTYAIWSIPVGFIFAALGIFPYSVAPLTVIGIVVSLIGLVLIAANPKELVNMRDN